MWNDRLHLRPLRGVEMIVECIAAVVIAGIIVLTVGSLGHATWKPEYAQLLPEIVQFVSKRP
jgi:hypothetical protein